MRCWGVGLRKRRKEGEGRDFDLTRELCSVLEFSVFTPSRMGFWHDVGTRLGDRKSVV